MQHYEDIIQQLIEENRRLKDRLESIPVIYPSKKLSGQM
jgi:hypothetical protein